MPIIDSILGFVGLRPMDRSVLTPTSPKRDLIELAGGRLGSITSTSAMFSSDFIACESVKARAIRSLPVHVMERTETGRIEAAGHPLNRVLHRPNALMAWGDMMAWAVFRRDCIGTAYIRVYRNAKGDPIEMRPVTESVSVNYDKDTGVAVYSADEDDMNPAWTCREDDLVIIKTDISRDGGITGKSIAETAAADIGLSVDLQSFYRSMMENGNHFSGYLETDSRLTIDDRKAIRESLDETRGPDNAGKIRIFDRGLKYRDVQIQLADMNIIEQERFVLEKVCRACHVDMHHVYGDGSITATAATGADIDFVKNTVLPEVQALEQAFQPILDRAYSLGGNDSGYRIKFDTNGLLRGDFKSRMEGYRIGIYSGMYTRAYCCTCEDIPWLPGQDKLLQPTAYYVLDDDGEPYIPNERTEGTEGQSDGISGIDPKRDAMSCLQPVIDNAQERIAKRASKDGDNDATRAFASMVMAPIEQAAALSGIYLMTGELVDAAIERGKN